MIQHRCDGDAQGIRSVRQNERMSHLAVICPFNRKLLRECLGQTLLPAHEDAFQCWSDLSCPIPGVFSVITCPGSESHITHRRSAEARNFAGEATRRWRQATDGLPRDGLSKILRPWRQFPKDLLHELHLGEPAHRAINHRVKSLFQR